jgi:hypothetical protein
MEAVLVNTNFLQHLDLTGSEWKVLCFFLLLADKNGEIIVSQRRKEEFLKTNSMARQTLNNIKSSLFKKGVIKRYATDSYFFDLNNFIPTKGDTINDKLRFRGN